MTLKGKGFYTSNLADCEEGDPAAILAAAQAAGLSHVVVKIAEGVSAYGFISSGFDNTLPVVQALRNAGISVWGWHPIYGTDPSGEAAIAIARTQALGLDGYVVDAGEEYQLPGMTAAARQFMMTVRATLEVPIALSSYRFPHFHPEFPWSTFLEFCDLHMPKVTWEQAHNPGEQLRESFRQCDTLPYAKPYIPTGAAYSASGWNPTVDEINDFLDTAKALGIPAVNFYNWGTCRQALPLLWSTVAGFDWSAPPRTRVVSATSIPLTDGFLVEFLAALNSGQAKRVTALYDSDATQVRADQVLRGATAIHDGYTTFFNSLPAGIEFKLSQVKFENDQCLFTWKAGSLTGETTFVINNGNIFLEYTYIF
jgi:hypothetical protein